MDEIVFLILKAEHAKLYPHMDRESAARRRLEKAVEQLGKAVEQWEKSLATAGVTEEEFHEEYWRRRDAEMAERAKRNNAGKGAMQ